MSVAVVKIDPKKKAVSTVGAWLTKDKGDVHVYTQAGMGTVIGFNKAYDDTINFSDLAVCIHEDGTIQFQWADEKGNAKFSPVPEKMLRDKILGLLNSLKDELA